MDLLGQMHEMLKDFLESEQGEGWAGLETLAQELGTPPRFTLTLTNRGVVFDLKVTWPAEEVT